MGLLSIIKDLVKVQRSRRQERLVFIYFLIHRYYQSKFQVCSGDILQFGVDVMENSRKVTHGCIIATLRLFLPDGKEAKASPTIVNTATGTSIPTQVMVV